MPAQHISTFGVALIGLTWLAYLAAIPTERIPRRPWVHVWMMLMGLAGTVAGLIEVPGSLTIANFVIAAALAGFFLYLLKIARLPPGARTFAVDDALPPFKASRSDGTPFDPRSLVGAPWVLKIFRGHW